MANFTDILVDADGDAKIEHGDFAIGNSDPQHIQHITFSQPGDWKQFPLIGFGVMQRLNSPGDLVSSNSIKSDLTLHLTLDNYKVIKITTGQTISELKINASR